jgi:hypothetical protein
MFKINNISWAVHFVPPFFYILKTDNGGYTLGACVKDNHTIYIANNLSLEKTKKVLCHEITHAAMFSYDVFLTLDQEELLADLIATYGNEIIEVTNKIFNKIKNKGESL